MRKSKKYNGYRAFQYLKAGFDYKDFKLCKELNRVPPFFLPLSKSEEERFQSLVEKNSLISLHEHPVLFPEDISQVMEYDHMGRNFMAYEALSLSGLDCIFDNLMDGTAYITSYSGWKWTDVIHDLGIRLSDIHHQKLIIPSLRVEDIRKAKNDGQIALVLCLESATPIENELDRIDVLYGLGVRSLGICYGESNMLGGGNRETIPTTGLSDFGYDAVKRMNKLGMLVDLSHANEKTALDTIKASDRPVYASHKSPSGIAVGGRGYRDDVLQALAEKDGVVGVGCAGKGPSTEKNPIGSIESYMETIEYCIKLMGINHVGCGPDTLYGDHQGLYKYWAEHELGQNSRPGRHPKIPPGKPTLGSVEDPGYVKGLENPNEFVNVARWMIKHGHSDAEISKVIGQNALRMLEQVWFP